MSNQENSLYWVSCNACAKGIFSKDAGSKESINMYMSNCGCLYCSRCVQSCTASGCFVCGTKSKVKVLPIGKNLPQSIMEMFNRTETSLSKMHRRIEYQNLHFERTLKLLRRKRKHVLEKLHNFKSSHSRRMKRRGALKKMEAKLKHKKATIQRRMRTKVSLEAKRGQQEKTLNLSETTNLTTFLGAVVSPPPRNFRPREQPPPSSNAGFFNFNNWF